MNHFFIKVYISCSCRQSRGFSRRIHGQAGVWEIPAMLPLLSSGLVSINLFYWILVLLFASNPAGFSAVCGAALSITGRVRGYLDALTAHTGAHTTTEGLMLESPLTRWDHRYLIDFMSNLSLNFIQNQLKNEFEQNRITRIILKC